MRVMLVVIALLLGANCLKDLRNPLTDNAVEAAPPVFLQEGKKYDFVSSGMNAFGRTVQVIDRNGWIKLDDGDWYNTNQLIRVTPK
jgi:hypothetical protein